MKTLNMRAHKERRTTITVVFLSFLIIIMILANSCSALKDPCKERAGMIGYGYPAKHR